MKAITVILLLTLLATLSNSDGGVVLINGGAGPGGLILAKQDRKLDFNIGNDNVEIDTRFSNSSIKYRTRFVLKTSGIPNIQGEFLRNSSVTPGKGFGFRVALLGMAEVNTGRGWDVKNSSNVVRFPGSDKLWSKIVMANVTGDNNVVIQKYTTTYVNSTNPNFNVTIDAYITPNTTTLNGVTLVPYSFKYGLTINNFPFMYNDSQLAIVNAIFYKSQAKIPDFSRKDGSLAIVPGARFNWTSTLSYTNSSLTFNDAIFPDNSTLFDSVNVAFKADNDPDKNGPEGAAVIVFRTQTGNYSRYSWDPEVAMNDDAIVADPATNPSSATSGAVMTTASFGLALVVLLGTFLSNFI